MSERLEALRCLVPVLKRSSSPALQAQRERHGKWDTPAASQACHIFTLNQRLYVSKVKVASGASVALHEAAPAPAPAGGMPRRAIRSACKAAISELPVLGSAGTATDMGTGPDADAVAVAGSDADADADADAMFTLSRAADEVATARATAEAAPPLVRCPNESIAARIAGLLARDADTLSISPVP